MQGPVLRIAAGVSRGTAWGCRGINSLVCDGKTLLACAEKTTYSALRSSASAKRVTAEAS
jgi:hypothetical protein